MRRAAFVLVWFVALATLAGCVHDRSILPPSLLPHERLQLKLERDQAVHKLEVLRQSESGGGPNTKRDIMDQELVILDLDWRLGKMPYNTYHTRRKHKLIEVRSYEEDRLAHGWTSQLDYDHVDLWVQHERAILGEIETATFDREREAFRERLAAWAARGARNDAAAASQVNNALVAFDEEMREK